MLTKLGTVIQVSNRIQSDQSKLSIISIKSLDCGGVNNRPHRFEVDESNNSTTSLVQDSTPINQQRNNIFGLLTNAHPHSPTDYYLGAVTYLCALSSTKRVSRRGERNLVQN